ncbi:MAG: glycosyl transferase [Gammaproteobacteria bacterium]|nr:glycosyl transferase [Gammaproteobacteria bacterium]
MTSGTRLTPSAGVFASVFWRPLWAFLGLVLGPLRWFIAGGGVAALAVAVYLAWIAFQEANLHAPRPGQLLLDAVAEPLAHFPSPDDGGGPDSAGYGYWPVTQSRRRIERATLALEDRRFYAHPGVDLAAMGRALAQNLRAGKRVSGASTIAMQIARIQRGGERTYWRKLEEAAIAVGLTLRYDRAAILAHYLRIVPYGNRLHGIANAARIYLRKPVKDLSWAEIAFLSAIPQAPSLSNPYRADGRERARARGRRLLNRLRQEGVLQADEYASALRHLAELKVMPKVVRPTQAMHWIVAAGRRLAGADAAPHVVRSTVDQRLQKDVSELLAEHLDQWRASGADNAAAVVIRLDDAAVLAWVGSGGYETGAGSGAIDFVRVRRSPGSTLKPFIYALALERGALKPDSVLADMPGAGGVVNADRGYLGLLLPRQALANSRNLPAVRVLRKVGLDTAYWMLHRLGIHDARKRAQHYGLGLAIGALPTTLERLATAYAALAAGGLIRPLRWFEHETFSGWRVMAQASARLVTLFLADAQARLPSFQRMGNTDAGDGIALKTGTSQGFRDAWTVAWTPAHLAAVWVGRADARAMHHLGGAQSAAAAAVAILKAVEGSHGAAPMRPRFAPPSGYRQAVLCAQSGTAAHGGCPRRVLEWLAGTPRQPVLRPVAIDVRTARAATPATPAEFLAVRPRAVITGAAGVSGEAGVPRIQSPPDGLRLVRLPGVPAARQTIALRAHVAGPPRPVVWHIGGKPWRQAMSNETLRWPLRPGEHRVSLWVSGARAPAHSVRVQVD